MPDFALLAVIGLLLFLPVEVIAIILIAAAARRRKFPEPRLRIPELPRQERYGWEDYLKLPAERKPLMLGRNIAISCAVVIFAILLALPLYFAFSPSGLNLSVGRLALANFTVEAPLLNAANLSAPQPLNLSLFSNFSVSHGFGLPEVNVSSVLEGSVSSYMPYLAAASAVTALLLVGLAVFVFIVRRRRLAVLRKAKKTADKLIQKAGQPKERAKLELGVYAVPAVILALLVIIAFLVYLLRDRIRNDFSGIVFGFAQDAGEFAAAYRLYIIAGIVLLAIIVAALRHFAAKRKISENANNSQQR